MKWIKIVGVAGTAFFTTLGGILTIDGLMGGQFPIDLLIGSSLAVASIQGFLALFREITTECDIVVKVKKRGGKKGSINLILENMIL